MGLLSAVLWIGLDRDPAYLAFGPNRANGRRARTQQWLGFGGKSVHVAPAVCSPIGKPLVADGQRGTRPLGSNIGAILLLWHCRMDAFSSSASCRTGAALDPDGRWWRGLFLVRWVVSVSGGGQLRR